MHKAKQNVEIEVVSGG